MSTKAFDEACQALARRSGSTSCDMSLDTRKDGEHQYLKIVRFLSTDPYSPARSHSNELLSAGQDSQCIHESGEIEEEVEDVSSALPFLISQSNVRVLILGQRLSSTMLPYSTQSHQ